MRNISLLVTAVLGLFTGWSDSVAATPARPNVLFIAVDDLRDWVGFMKRHPQAKTPNIDRLAKMGLAFTRAYPAAPVCNPARAALMSGFAPSTTGVYENRQDWRPVVPPEKTLPSVFRAAGYRVTGAGKIYHRAYARPSEWDDYHTGGGGAPAVPEGQSTGVGGIMFAPLDCRDEDLPDYRFVSYAIAELGKRHDQPFFLAVGLDKPHMPWNVPRKYYDLFPLEGIKLPPYQKDDMADVPAAGIRMAHPETDHEPMLQSGRWKEAVQAYLAAIAYTDMNIGRLLDAFEKSPDRANTIICFWGDHGWHLGEKHHWRKFTLWEEGGRTPFIWVAPGVTKAGTTSDRPVSLQGIYATLTELCGIPTPSHVETRSLRPLLANPQAAWDVPVVTTYRFKNHTVRVDGWRYIRYANGDEELYDEAKDPNEWTNLAGKPEHAARIAALKKFLPAKDAPELPEVPDNEDNAKAKAKKKKK